jgi:hypothetical protein
MRHVPLSEFADRVDELVAAADRGEDIAIVHAGREVALVLRPKALDALPEGEGESRRLFLERMARHREGLRVRGVPTVSTAEIREWIDEGRP